jgi:hypothetical protein
MSFQEPRDALSICNRALSQVKQQQLQSSLDDPANNNKLSARECRIWYKPTVRMLLEKHHWGLATKRVALAEVTNDRTIEWAAKYAAPADMAFPVMIGPYSTLTGVSYYQGLGYILGSLYGRPVFRYENGFIYGILSGAIVDYVSYDITEADFTQVFEDLVVAFLAARLARSVAKDDKLADDLHNAAVAHMNTAIAQNLNLQGQRYGDRLSETELARDGFDPIVSPLGYYS